MSSTPQKPKFGTSSSEGTQAKTPFQSNYKRRLNRDDIKAVTCRPTATITRTGSKTPFITARLGSLYKSSVKAGPLFGTTSHGEKNNISSNNHHIITATTNATTNNNHNNNHNNNSHHHNNYCPIVNNENLTISSNNRTTVNNNSVSALPKTPARTQPPISVNKKIFNIIKRIGTGGSAIVYEALDPSTLSTYAIKVIDTTHADYRTKENYANEISLLKQLRDCEHVVRIFDWEYKKPHKQLVIVMEKGEDLSQFIEFHIELDSDSIRYWWRRMVKAVDEIHRHGIIHSDLKLVNFILVKKVVKLIDFGISNAVELDEGTSVIKDFKIGTINYMAPEALRNRAGDSSFRLEEDNNCDKSNQQPRTVIKYNSKVDIWSLGCILYNLVYGRPPFDKHTDTYSKIQAITNPNYQIDFPQMSNKDLMHCLKSCLKYDPTDRPSAKALLDGPYLREALR